MFCQASFQFNPARQNTLGHKEGIIGVASKVTKTILGCPRIARAIRETASRPSGGTFGFTGQCYSEGGGGESASDGWGERFEGATPWRGEMPKKKVNDKMGFRRWKSIMPTVITSGGTVCMESRKDWQVWSSKMETT